MLHARNVTARVVVGVTCGILLGLPTGALESYEEEHEEEHEEEEEEDQPRIQFQAPEVTARPGETVSVSISAASDVPLTMATFSLEFNTSAAALTTSAPSAEVLSLLEAHPEADSSFIWHQDEDAGWVQASLVVDYRALSAIPAGSVPLVSLTFQVKEGTPEGRYSLEFTRPEEAEYEGHFEDSLENPVYHSARSEGEEFEEETEFDDDLEPGLVDGAIVVSIIGDVSVFARGDANADHALNISDPIRIFSYLFLGAEAPPCADAADANDDGGINLSDAITLLGYLFADPGPGVLPSATLAADPTADDLGCARY
jgi:hypothetical protein